MQRIVRTAAAALLIACARAASAHAWNLIASSPECGETGPLPPACGNIVFDGDSIPAGQGASRSNGLDSQFMRNLHYSARVTNVSAPGGGLYHSMPRYQADVAPLYIPGARLNLIVFHAGDNDFRGRHSAGQIYGAFARYVAMAHAQGWKIIMTTELPRPDFDPELAAGLMEYNRLILGNTAHADLVVDITVDRRFTDLAARATSPLFYRDHMHPNDSGYAILGHMIAVAAQPLLPR